MIVNKELALSKGCLDKDLWETPQDLFDKLNNEFDFTLDPCCTKETARCDSFFTPEDDGLSQSWLNNRCFVNPPYSRGNIDKWVKKCFEEGNKPYTLVVALLPVSTSSGWFHKYINDKATVRFIKGRVRFRGAKFTAPFSSMIVIW